MTFTDDSETGVSTPYVSSVKSEAEIALENFMEKWRKGIVADMVEYHGEELAGFALSDQPQPAALLEICAEAAAGLAADGCADGHGREHGPHDHHSG